MKQPKDKCCKKCEYYSIFSKETHNRFCSCKCHGPNIPVVKSGNSLGQEGEVRLLPSDKPSSFERIAETYVNPILHKDFLEDMNYYCLDKSIVKRDYVKKEESADAINNKCCNFCMRQLKKELKL